MRQAMSSLRHLLYLHRHSRSHTFVPTLFAIGDNTIILVDRNAKRFIHHWDTLTKVTLDIAQILHYYSAKIRNVA